MKGDKRIKDGTITAECRYCQGQLRFHNTLRAVGWAHSSPATYLYCITTFQQPGETIDQKLTERNAIAVITKEPTP